MKGLLVSFCNVSPPDFILGAYEFENDCFQWIDITQIAPGSLGATGIASANGHYWLVRQTDPPCLIKLNTELKTTGVYFLSISRDAHSLVPYDEGFLINDTRHNRINLVRLSEDASVFDESEFWRQCQSDKDETHVNSICCLNGHVYASLFGQRPEQGWQFSQMGQILNISTGEIVCDKLHHPHTLVSWSGDVYWLESKAGLVHKYTPGGKHEVLLHLDGYLRGLAFDNDFMYVGASALRRHSRSTGTLNQIASDNPDDFCCWIYRVSLRTGQIERRNLTGYGAEIYDLLLVPAMPFEMSRSSSAYAATRRLWRIEDDFCAHEGVLKQRIQQCEQELRQWQEKAAKLENELAYVQKELARIRGTRWWRTRTILGRLLRQRP